MKKNRHPGLFVSYPLIIPVIILIFIFAIGVYTIYDDNRVILVRQDIQIEGLPPEFDGFTILQLSDLHSQRFGDTQQRLVNLINSLDYDAIAFTGDMQDSRTKDILPFLEIIRGIEKITPKFYIAGNTGPYDVAYYYKKPEQYTIDISTGQVLEFGKLLQREGCTLLDLPQAIERGKARMWFAADFSPVVSSEVVGVAQKELEDTSNQGLIDYLQTLIDYQMKLQRIYAGFNSDDTLIGIFHFPLTDQELKDLHNSPPYDVVLAGHYHGGQVRIPLYGAIYIPDITLPWRGFFPPQEMVSGLFIGKNIQQYVSRGLGASSRYPFLQFRLFNTPEINLIKLKSSSDSILPAQ
jgi:uncharacterized protein